MTEAAELAVTALPAAMGGAGPTRQATRAVRRLFATLMAAACVLLMVSGMPAEASAPSTTTLLSVVSEPGDPVGQGEAWAFTDANGTVQFGGNEGDVRFRILANHTDYQVELTAPAGQQLTTGSYTNAGRAGFNGTHPGLWVAGEGRGCNTDTGSFVIRSLATAASGAIVELDVSFTQYCDGASAPLRGVLKYQAPQPPAVPLSSSHPITVQGEPTTLTAQAPSGSAVSFYDGSTRIGAATADSHQLARFTTAALGVGTRYLTARVGSRVSPRVVQSVSSNRTSFWYHSAVGDSSGAGATGVFAPTWSTLSISGTTKRFVIDAVADTGWQIAVEAPVGTVLHTGSYGHTQGSATTGSAGLGVAGAGGCNAQHGSFRILSMHATASGTITDVALTFVEYCDNDAYPNTGTARFTSG